MMSSTLNKLFYAAMLIAALVYTAEAGPPGAGKRRQRRHFEAEDFSA